MTHNTREWARAPDLILSTPPVGSLALRPVTRQELKKFGVGSYRDRRGCGCYRPAHGRVHGWLYGSSAERSEDCVKPQTITAQRLTRARTQLLLNQPFFGTLCLRLNLALGSLPTRLPTPPGSSITPPSWINSIRRNSRERSLKKSCTARWDTTAAAANAIQNSGMKPRTWPSTLFCSETVSRSLPER